MITYIKKTSDSAIDQALSVSAHQNCFPQFQKLEGRIYLFLKAPYLQKSIYSHLFKVWFVSRQRCDIYGRILWITRLNRHYFIQLEQWRKVLFLVKNNHCKKFHGLRSSEQDDTSLEKLKKSSCTLRMKISRALLAPKKILIERCCRQTQFNKKTKC